MRTRVRRRRRRASPLRSAWRSRPTARRSTSRRSARAPAACSAPPSSRATRSSRAPRATPPAAGAGPAGSRRGGTRPSCSRASTTRTPSSTRRATPRARGRANAGPMHWRGDRTAGNAPGGAPLDENGAFLKFIVAFDGLVGKAGSISSTEMQQFADFILQVTSPPNPIRHLDDSLTSDQQAGRNFYFNITSDTVQTCNGCHHLDPILGFFGTDGFSSFEAETQDFKIPHLRNAYQKVGMFGMPALNSAINAGNNGNQGPQVRGFGFLHDGSVDTLFRFHNATVFNGGVHPHAGGTPRPQAGPLPRGLGHQPTPSPAQPTTPTNTNAATVGPRIDLLLARAGQNECDVVVKGTVGGVQRGAVRVAGTSNLFKIDRAADPLLTDAQMRNLATTSGQELTYSCVPPGSGIRIGIDRDQDGCL